MISGVQLLLERGELKIARKMRDTSSTSRRTRFGTDTQYSHNDTVIVLALACWRAKREQLTFESRRLPDF